jgi:hypothetical protein
MKESCIISAVTLLNERLPRDTAWGRRLGGSRGAITRGPHATGVDGVRLPSDLTGNLGIYTRASKTDWSSRVLIRIGPHWH